MSRLASHLSRLALFVVFALPVAAQVPLEVKVAPGAVPFDFHGFGPYRPRVPRPDSLLGYPIGTRHTMYHQQQAVLDAMVAAAPDRARFEVTGRSGEGKVMRVVVISSPANIARVDAMRRDLAALADARVTDAAAAEAIIARTPAVAFLSHSIHGNEPAGFETAMLTVYTLLASEAPAIRSLLDSVVVVINPSQNPDGHERFAAWSNSVALGLDDPAALEQSEPWSIQGRFNRHRFDMNRDLLAWSQPETRNTGAAVRDWWPQVFVDLHSTTAQYFFAPAAAPVNANLPAASVDWMETFGRGNAAAFDRHGWQYFVRDVFDLYYPGYWDSWPSLRGATGMTFETDGGPELMLRKGDGSVTTFREGIAHHFVASLATLTTLAQHRTARLRDFREFFASALTLPGTRAFRRVVISGGNDPARTREVIELLRLQGIEVHATRGELTLQSARGYLGDRPARRRIAPGSWVIDLAQPQGRLATALLEPSATLDSAFARKQLDRFERNRRRGDNQPREGYEFYDVTAWALPLTHGLDAVWTDEAITNLVPIEERTPMNDVMGQPSRSGYLIRPGTRASQSLALALLREGFRVGVATTTLRANNDAWEPGTIVLRSVRNPDSLFARLDALARRFGASYAGVSSAFPDAGQVGIGSDAVRTVSAPKILVAAGDGVSQTAFGDVWQYLERELQQPFVPVEPRRLASMALDEYNVLVLPDGSYAGTLGTGGMHRIRDWVRAGGALIAFGSAVDLLAHEEMGLRAAADAPKGRDTIAVADTTLSPSAAPGGFTSPTARGNTRPEPVPGAIARAELDPTHWLRWGYAGDALAVPVPGDFLLPTTRGDNVVRFAEHAPILAGFTWPGNTEKFLRGSVWATVERSGRGTVVAFADNPLFRGFWRGTAMLFTNAVLFGAGRP